MLKEKNGIVVDAQVTMADVDSQLMLWLKSWNPSEKKILIPLLFLRMLPSMKDGFLGKTDSVWN